MASERALVKRIIAELNSWPHTRAVKVHGSSYGRVGDPDIWGSRFGKMFLLEMKMPGKKPTKIQAVELERWKRTGAVTGWYDNFDEAIARVRAIAPVI
jgi:hypothetical protein